MNFVEPEFAMRTRRLLALALHLQLRRHATAGELAREFRVAERTIYRDLDELSASGVPVVSERGPGGGFHLMPGYRVSLAGLAAEEAEALPLLALPTAIAALGITPAAERAQQKLRAALPSKVTRAEQRLGDHVHVDPVGWYQDEPDPPFLPEIAQAALARRRIAMRYESWRATRDWQVDPLGLVLKAGAWYLVARATGDRPRIFRVAMIRALTVDGTQSFERPSDFDLAGFWQRETARFEGELRTGSAILLATDEGRRRLAEQGAYARRALAEAVDLRTGRRSVETAVDGREGGASSPRRRTSLRAQAALARGFRFRLVLPIESAAAAARLVLGLGGEVAVESPAAVLRAVRDLAVRIASLHGAGPNPNAADRESSEAPIRPAGADSPPAPRNSRTAGRTATRRPRRTPDSR